MQPLQSLKSFTSFQAKGGVLHFVFPVKVIVLSAMFIMYLWTELEGKHMTGKTGYKVGPFVMRSKFKWISYEQLVILPREMNLIKPVLFKWHWIPHDENELPFRCFCYYTL